MKKRQSYRTRRLEEIKAKQQRLKEPKKKVRPIEPLIPFRVDKKTIVCVRLSRCIYDKWGTNFKSEEDFNKYIKEILTTEK